MHPYYYTAVYKLVSV